MLVAERPRVIEQNDGPQAIESAADIAGRPVRKRAGCSPHAAHGHPFAQELSNRRPDSLSEMHNRDLVRAALN